MGISGFVAATGETVNLVDAYADPRFDPSVDAHDKAGFKHETVLCMPINGGVGVFLLVNKFDGLPFTRNDENFVEAFGIFCGMGISNVRMYEKAVVAMAKQQVNKQVSTIKTSV